MNRTTNIRHKKNSILKKLTKKRINGKYGDQVRNQQYFPFIDLDDNINAHKINNNNIIKITIDNKEQLKQFGIKFENNEEYFETMLEFYKRKEIKTKKIQI